MQLRAGVPNGDNFQFNFGGSAEELKPTPPEAGHKKRGYQSPETRKTGFRAKTPNRLKVLLQTGKCVKY
jgi:hypothetical protein